MICYVLRVDMVRPHFTNKHPNKKKLAATGLVVAVYLLPTLISIVNSEDVFRGVNLGGFLVAII